MVLRLTFIAALLLILLVGACQRRAPPPAPRPEHTNAAGIAIIKEIEALRLTPYKLDGQWYVGYGHALEKPGPAITEAEAERLLKKDLAICEEAIRQTVTAPVNANEFSAMASLCYTLGVPSFADTSVIKRLNVGDRKGAADAFLLFTKSRGRDRQAENARGAQGAPAERAGAVPRAGRSARGEFLIWSPAGSSAINQSLRPFRVLA